MYYKKYAEATKLATKSTHKKKDFDLKKTALLLDQLIDQVSLKPVFVVGRSGNYYQVINYNDKTVVVNFLPTREIAEKIMNKYNAQFKYTNSRKREIAESLRSYVRYNTELEHYEYVLAYTTDSDIKLTTWIRIQNTEIKKQNTVKLLKSLI